jgi:hypothetical protein
MLIPGYPDYDISKRGGKIISYKQKEPRVLKTWIDHNGSENVRLHKYGEQYAHPVGNLVLRSWVGPCPEGMECRHGPLGRRCHDVSNLCWGTHKENVEDMARDGTVFYPKGKKNGRAKLTEQDVLDIRANSGLTYRQLAAKYNVSQSLIGYIINRKNWKHI